MTIYIVPQKKKFNVKFNIFAIFCAIFSTKNSIYIIDNLMF